MATNPDYDALFAQIAVETDPVIKQQLIDQAYVFNEPLTAHEKELFAYVYDDYIEDNPGYVQGFDPTGSPLYVLEGYVANGYINIESTDIDLYVLAGYVEDGYLKTTPSTGFISYVGKYYNNNGETT